jgi:hypothetical protein
MCTMQFTFIMSSLELISIYVFTIKIVWWSPSSSFVEKTCMTLSSSIDFRKRIISEIVCQKCWNCRLALIHFISFYFFVMLLMLNFNNLFSNSNYHEASEAKAATMSNVNCRKEQYHMYLRFKRQVREYVCFDCQSYKGVGGQIKVLGVRRVGDGAYWLGLYESMRQS